MQFISAQTFPSLCALASALCLAACGSSSALDPKTVVKSDLNPPAGLVSITTDSSFTLQWRVTNTEDDVKGYNVYVIEGSIADLQAKHLKSGAFKGLDLATQQVRRCKDTAGLFTAFGFDANADQAKSSCDDFVSADSGTTVGSGRAAAPSPDTESGASLADGAAGAVACQSSDNKPLGSKGLSLDITKAVDANGKKVPTEVAARADLTLTCTLPKDSALSSGTKGFTNGKKYVAFVVAVQGDAGDTISYTSNFVEDIPTAIADTITSDKLGPNVYVTIELDPSKGTIGFDGTPGLCKAGACRLTPTADLDYLAPAGISTIAIMSDQQSATERILVSGEKNKVWLAPARPRNDFGPGDVVPGIYEPGDRVLAFEASQYATDKRLEVVPGSLFYVAVKNATGTYNYGKLYFRSVSTTAGSNGVAAGAGLKSFSAVMALQPAAGETFAERVAILPAFFSRALRSF